MSINCFLAMTAAEFTSAVRLPGHVAWMACHFSLYGTGLTNLPRSLPAGSMVIVNDRIPPHRHDPIRIAEQLVQLEDRLDISGFLLDFQQKNESETMQIAKRLVRSLSAPVGVSEAFCADLDCPVFLSPPPLHIPLADYLSGWQDREIWLEAAIEAGSAHISGDGCQYREHAYAEPPAPHFPSTELFCRYTTKVSDDSAVFTFYRGTSELEQVYQRAEELKISRAIGLYQQLAPQKAETPETL